MNEWKAKSACKLQTARQRQRKISLRLRCAFAQKAGGSKKECFGCFGSFSRSFSMLFLLFASLFGCLVLVYLYTLVFSYTRYTCLYTCMLIYSCIPLCSDFGLILPQITRTEKTHPLNRQILTERSGCAQMTLLAIDFFFCPPSEKALDGLFLTLQAISEQTEVTMELESINGQRQGQ